MLSGYLDDGTSGLWSIHRLGGKVIVQDPRDASFPDMPANAMAFVKPDYVVPIDALTTLLVRLTMEAAPAPPKVARTDLERLKIEITIARHDNAFEMSIIDKGKLTPFTCPDCHGTWHVGSRPGEVAGFESKAE